MLHVARNKQTCKWLLDMGATYSSDFMSEAFTNGHMNVVHCLFDDELEAGNCDTIDSILSKGYIPEPNSILVPCKKGNITLVTTLLKYKMNCQEGIAIAVKSNYFHLLEPLFLGGVDLNFSYKDGKKLLHLAKDFKTYQWLLDMGAAILPDDNGNLPVSPSP